MAIFAVSGLTAWAQEACCRNIVGALQAPDSIRIVLDESQLPQRRPAVIKFGLRVRDLGALREALARGPVTVTVVAPDGRQLLSRGTLLTIDSTINDENLRLRALFPN